jgi:hypothetical protein
MLVSLFALLTVRSKVPGGLAHVIWQSIQDYFLVAISSFLLSQLFSVLFVCLAICPRAGDNG